MALRISFFSSICSAISRAFRSLIPLTSASLSGSSSMMRKVSSLNRRTMRPARAAPSPLMAPEPRYLSMETRSSGSHTSEVWTWSWTP